MAIEWRGRKSKGSARKGSGGYEAKIPDGPTLDVREYAGSWVWFVRVDLHGSEATQELAQATAERIAVAMNMLFPTGYVRTE